MNEIFSPSLPLLLIKTALIFGIAWGAGWTVCPKRIFENDFLHWTLRLIAGVAFLNICVVNASLWGATGQIGMLAAALALAARIVIERRRPKPAAVPAASRKRVAVFAAVSAVTCINYFAPFIVENTSGYYSRAGGDHSTYLAFSDYFVSGRLYKKIDLADIIPPRPYWEVHYFVRNRQALNSRHAQPLTNQYIATPFMALLPGSNEETYTAAVAFYLTLAVWCAVALAGVLTKCRHRNLAIVALLLSFSNLLLFAAGQHAIPFLFATGLLNMLLALFREKTAKSQWSLTEESSILCFALAGTLLLIYPHLFLFWGALEAALLVIFFRSVRESLLTVRLGAVTVLAALLVTNLGLFITWPLVRTGATGITSHANAYSLKEILAVQSGIVDFGVYNVPGLTGKDGWSELGTRGLMLCAVFGLVALWRARWRAAIALAVLCAAFAAATSYYVHKNLFYQAMRLTQTGHLFYISLGALGIAWVSTSRRIYIAVPGLCAAGFLIYGSIKLRTFVVKEVMGVIDSYQVEFRRAGHLKLANILAEKSRTPGGVALNWVRTPYPITYVSDRDFEHDRTSIPKALVELPGGLKNASFFKQPAQRVVYYFGPGYGVDLAGATLLLRYSSYLMAHGYAYNAIWDPLKTGLGPNLWNPSFLTNCFLAIQPPRGSDILTDRRDGSTPPLWRLNDLVVYDTKVQNAAEIVGDSWNATQYQGDQPYRYLRGIPGALVIWSQKDETARLTMLVHGNKEKSALKIASEALKAPVTFDLDRWVGTRDRKQAHTLELNLKPGPNVLHMTPAGNPDDMPWPLFWWLNICSGGGSEYCEGAPLKKIVPGEVPGGSNAKVFMSVTQVYAGQSIEASWSGVDEAAKNDWIGIFPVGGEDRTRLVFRFTQGGRRGKLVLSIPTDTEPGDYELRLFSKGVWTKMAASAPFVIKNPGFKKSGKKK
jgi:hypothetical protein